MKNTHSDRVILPHSAEKTKESDWKIQDLYSTAWETVKRNKILWVLGGALAMTTNMSSSVSSESERSSFPISIDESNLYLLEKFTSGIPSYLWYVLGLEVLIIILFITFMSLLQRSWATGAMIYAADRAVNKKDISISDASENSFLHMRKLIYLWIYSALPILGVSILLALAYFVILAIDSLIFAAAIALVVLTITIGLMFVLLILRLIFAERAVVLDNQDRKQAFAKAKILVSKKKWSILLLGLVNVIGTSIIVSIPAAIIGAIAAAGISIYTSGNSAIGAIIMGIGGIVSVPVIILLMVLTGMLTAFTTVVWNEAYKKVKDKY